MPTLPPSFVVAVFSQPISSFPKWKARGINTLVSHEPEGGHVKKSDWEAAKQKLQSRPKAKNAAAAAK